MSNLVCVIVLFELLFVLNEKKKFGRIINGLLKLIFPGLSMAESAQCRPVVPICSDISTPALPLGSIGRTPGLDILFYSFGVESVRHERES